MAKAGKHDHLLDDACTIDPAWLERVAEVASWALEEGMYVIINIHHDNDINFLYPDSMHYEQSAKYVAAIWSQVAAKFADCDEHVIFESMNEPRLVGKRNSKGSLFRSKASYPRKMHFTCRFVAFRCAVALSFA
jgi:aryl-phospho-beta-D-glucosidase BglC (GH1 family)